MTSYDRLKSLFRAGTPYIPIGIVLLGIASYANTLDVPIMFDDYYVIRFSKDFSIDSFDLLNLLQRPRWFVDLTFFLNRQLHGDRVLGFHLFNLVIHLSSAGVIYLLVQQAVEALKRTFRISGDDESLTFLQRFIPLATAALFVCHPVQTQAVTYITQRYSSLTTFLYLNSLFAYLQARLSLEATTEKRRVWLWGTTSFLLALLAMKSKEIAFTLPLMTVVFETAFFQGRLLKNRFFLALVGVLLLVIPLQLILTIGEQTSENLIDHIQSATTETQNISRNDYLLTQFRVVATYLRLLILPVNQNLDYDYPVFHSLLDPSVYASLLLHIILAGLALVLFFRSHKLLTSGNPSAGIAMRLAGLGIVWFYLALSVESSLIPIRDVIFEHRVYLPSVGFFMSATAGLAGITLYNRRWVKPLSGAILVVCLALTTATISRNRLWSDELAMWQDVLKKSPEKARIHFNIGFIYFRGFMPEKAMPYLVMALKLDSTVYRHWFTLNSAISMIDRYKGRSSSGREYFSTMNIVDPAYMDPWKAVSYNNLGLAYEHLGDLVYARGFYQKAITYSPDLDFAWYNLALLAARQNDTSTVKNSLEKLRTINPQMEQSVHEAMRAQAGSIQLVPQ